MYYFCYDFHYECVLGMPYVHGLGVGSQVRFLSFQVTLLSDPQFSSVERVVEYLELPQEPPAIIESQRPPAYWPSSTTKDPLIHVENLVIKYAPDLPPVLHDVSFSLQSKERIGLLGRTGMSSFSSSELVLNVKHTGSGKSTLAMSLLRFVGTLPWP